MEGHLVDGLLLSHPAGTNTNRSVSQLMQPGRLGGGFMSSKAVITKYKDCACAGKLLGVNVKLFS